MKFINGDVKINGCMEEGEKLINVEMKYKSNNREEGGREEFNKWYEMLIEVSKKGFESEEFNIEFVGSDREYDVGFMEIGEESYEIKVCRIVCKKE